MTASHAVEQIGVVGAGAWGTALALAAMRAGSRVLLWARDPQVAEALAASRENKRYLPGVPLPEEIAVTSDRRAVAGCDALLLVVPAQVLRDTVRQLAADVPSRAALVICAKGFERNSGALLSQVLEQELPGRAYAVLTGPTFASEVARGLPAAATLACSNGTWAERLVAALGSKSFRPYLSDDPLGAQIGGAVKNVLAIACGIVAGRGFGDNARAALVARGLAEMMRLGLALGGRRETLMGLSGLGDLVLTCTSVQSRNYALGVALGEGRSASGALTEGVATAAVVARLARDQAIDMPISQAVDQVVNGGAGVAETIEHLLARPFTSEFA